jgi:hypothetical protein
MRRFLQGLLVFVALGAIGWFIFRTYGFGPFRLGGIEVPRILGPAPASTQAGPGGTPELVMRFTWQGEVIRHLGNVITEEEFIDLAREAQEGGGRVEIEQMSDVTVETSTRRRAALEEIGVQYQINAQ